MFRWQALAGLLLLWLVLVFSEAPCYFVFAVLSIPSLPLAAVVGSRRQGSVGYRLTVALMFVAGWCLLSGYFAIIAVAAHDSEPDWSTRFAGLDEIVAAILGVVFAVPATIVGILLYRSWIWSAFDARYSKEHSLQDDDPKCQ